MSLEFLNNFTYGWIILALLVHVLLFFVAAPFGRHTSENWGLMINNKLAWIIMEFPSLIIMVFFLFYSKNSFNSFAWIIFSLWILHYINRTFIYPLRIKPTEKKMPVFIMLNAIFFNIINAGLNGYFLANFAQADRYDFNWLTSPITISGFLLFFTGMAINWKSDSILINLRKPKETGYKIPEGFLFEYVTSPNLFGEIIEWAGFAIVAWNLPALAFAVWTYANLVPRARNHHDWYLKHFDDYPENRKIVFPFIY